MKQQVGENGPLDQSTVDFADVFAGEDMPTSISLTLRSGPIELTREQLENLSWSDHVALWKVSFRIARRMLCRCRLA